MSDAPERIWASAYGEGVLIPHFHFGTNIEFYEFEQTEYVRADKVQALVDAERERCCEAIVEPISAYLYDVKYKLRNPVTSHTHQYTYEAAQAAIRALPQGDVL